MKKMILRAAALVCVATLSSCATPERNRRYIQPPAQRSQPATQTAGQQAGQTSAAGQTGAQQIPGSPQYVHVEDSGQDVVVEDLGAAVPSMTYLEDRLARYTRKLDRWKELDARSAGTVMSDDDTEQMVNCFRNLQSVINGYTVLRGMMMQVNRGNASVALDRKRIYELQKNDIEFLEGSCGRMLASDDEDVLKKDGVQNIADISTIEGEIDRYNAVQDYPEVVKLWNQIPEVQQERVNLRTQLLYANALKILHQDGKAAEIYSRVIKQMAESDEQPTDLVTMRRLLGDLYTSTGNFTAAANQYSKIADEYAKLGRQEEWARIQLSILTRAGEETEELKKYSQLLRGYLSYYPNRDGFKISQLADTFLSEYPYSAVASNVDYIKTQTQEKADRWFNNFFSKADQLAGEKKYTEALEHLDTVPMDIIGADKQIAIQEKSEGLRLAEAVEKETEKMAQLQELQHQWNNGMLLVKDERYEEAISVFTGLLNTEYKEKAEQKIQEISLEAAKADRKKAANLFIRYTKTTDQESRKQLLLETRKVLRGILVKYPNVEISSKVQGNIDRVEQEMSLIDPNLLDYAKQQEKAALPLDGTDAAFNLGNKTQTPQPVQTPTTQETERGGTLPVGILPQ